MNLVILRGHLGDDPRNNTTNTKNVAVCNFRMATNRKWNDAQGQKQERSEWHNVVCWDKLALTVGQHMKKGSQVLVEGRLEERPYEVVVQKECVDANGNVMINPATNTAYIVNVKEKRYSTEVIARSVQFLDKNPGTSAYTPAGAAVVGQPVVVGSPFVMDGQPVGTTTVVQPNLPAAGPDVGDGGGPFVNAGGTVSAVAVPGV
jgi:single-stranded DNA-binding protein